MTTAVLPGQLALDLDAQPDEEQKPGQLPAYVPSERLRPHIAAWLAGGRTMKALAAKSRVGVETIRAIVTGARAETRFGTADRLIVAIDPWALAQAAAPRAGRPLPQPARP
ncbi:MAG: hypothetical protein ACRDMU_02875 [Gaiellaceae bacterium]